MPLYLEHIYFLVKKAMWPVTKMKSHYTFDQKPFKKSFILTNQKSRQDAKSHIEKDFHKPLNNSNFTFDCRTNMGSCVF